MAMHIHPGESSALLRLETNEKESTNLNSGYPIADLFSIAVNLRP